MNSIAIEMILLVLAASMVVVTTVLGAGTLSMAWGLTGTDAVQ